ncbi:60S ribosomal protein L18-2-like [Pyrus ussuriensis x Pyrus communis]|uniref:60S ribosomal protein L18-2-like n=1 Tax=Pyrus ussuriensis x Pyrus communis TaxID=2448454 RepID=A0A5N5I9G4_9ROSA|nr:60S ribosomal protein L18-2-like [Pyrus ussuriensis x Pyrus communis]
MKIDLVVGGKSKKTKHTVPKFDDIYLKLLVKLKLTADILKRLFKSKVNKAPLSLLRLIKYMQGKDSKIDMVVGTVIKFRVYEVPQLKVTTLRFTETVSTRIEKPGGYHTKTYVRSKGRKFEKAISKRNNKGFTV